MKKMSTLVLLAVSLNATAQEIRIISHPDQQKTDIFIGKELFTSLLYADSLKKPILYPIHATGNTTITRGWPLQPEEGDPVDHPHQSGLWFNYGDVNGADYWNNSTRIDTMKKAYGAIRFGAITNIESGNGKASLQYTAVWYNPGGRAVLKETTRYVFRVKDGIRSIGRETTLKALEPVSFRDNKEGLFGLRVAPDLEQPSEKAVDVYSKNGTTKAANRNATGLYESSRSLKGDSVFGKRAGWVKLTGTVNKKHITLVIFDHPSNPNYPGFWMARGYGLFAINPLGAAVYTNGKETFNLSLKTGETATFNYSLLIASQTLSNEKISAMFKVHILK